MNKCVIEIYTDGSCDTQYQVGAWAAILIVSGFKTLIHGEALHTTHNRMELQAVIKAIEYAFKNYDPVSFVVYTDSQYVSRISERKEKLKKNHFLTKKGNKLQNQDLVEILIDQIETHTIEFVKVKAHSKVESDSLNAQVQYNSEVDKFVRKEVRNAVKNK